MDFWQVYDELYRPVRKFIGGVVKDDFVADDLVQDTFIRVEDKLHTVDDDAKIRAWVFRIAHNLCIDYFRGERARDRREQLAPWEERIQEAAAQKLIEQCQMGACVQDKVACLQEPSRSVIAMFDMAELSHQEIADVYGISVGAVKVRLHRARKALKEILQQACQFERDERGVLVCVPGPDQPTGPS